MQEEDYAIERMVLVELMRFNATIFGLIAGLLLGLAIFIVTNIRLLQGGDVADSHLGLLGQFFIGYKVSFGGSLIGFLYGLLSGFLIGYLFAHLYNWIAHFRERKRPFKGQS
jgi:hypothetical protein